MSLNRKHVVVLMGGTSLEHDISLKSGAMVMQNLDENKYRVTPVEIALNGRWHFSGGDGLQFADAAACLSTIEPDCVFIALHGPFGEDGRIQGLLDLLDIPYTGSGCAASALSMDKVRAKAVAENAGIRVARQLTVTASVMSTDGEAFIESVGAELGFPCVVKSPWQGSSLGMSMPGSVDDLRSSLEDVLKLGGVAMVEQYIKGIEVTCAVLESVGKGVPEPLPVTEIVPVAATYFDFEAKYSPGATEEITPARIADDMTIAVQELAVKAHQLMGCRHMSRSDMIIDDDGPVWIEVNTIPGLTEMSLLPQAAAAVGISFGELLDRLVTMAIDSAEHCDRDWS